MDAYTAFKKFILARLGCSQLRHEDNPAYQNAMNTIEECTDKGVSDSVCTLISIAENSAYLQGFQDGLSIMAGLGFSE